MQHQAHDMAAKREPSASRTNSHSYAANLAAGMAADDIENAKIATSGTALGRQSWRSECPSDESTKWTILRWISAKSASIIGVHAGSTVEQVRHGYETNIAPPKQPLS
jgi:hypothetical protein